MTVTTVVDARTTRIDSEGAWKLLRGARSIITAKGDKVQSWNPQSEDKSEILQHVIGPSGNLRAPTIRVNDEFVVGFNADLYGAWLSRK